MKTSTIRYATLGLTILSCATLAACGGDASSLDHYGYHNGGAYAPAMDLASGEQYETNPENDFIEASVEDTSTFSIDVDNASYTLMRDSLENGQLPSPDSVRPEEYINYFDYGYDEPIGDDPFSINLEVAPSKFGADKHLMRVGIKGLELHEEDMLPTNLVFLIDVSGSMQSEEKLPLVKQSLRTLLDNLRPSDTVGIVVYAGADGVVLDSTPVRERAKIEHALDNLAAGGGTNAEAGIVSAYQMAERARIDDGNNRVIILTDGDFNVGKTGDDLYDLIDTYREREISLTCMGYGRGNYHDRHMENLSKRGNGNYFYVDSINEAKRVFGERLVATLQVIAADVKIQVEFNEDAISRYRLIGYENRLLENEDFEDDTKDAGEIGPGHTVTAYYELELTEGAEQESVLSEVRIRYKNQYGEESQQIDRAIKLGAVHPSFDEASAGFRFGAAVAEFAEVLRDSKHVDSPDLSAVEAVATAATDGHPTKSEFLKLVGLAIGMDK